MMNLSRSLPRRSRSPHNSPAADHSNRRIFPRVLFHQHSQVFFGRASWRWRSRSSTCDLPAPTLAAHTNLVQPQPGLRALKASKFLSATFRRTCFSNGNSAASRFSRAFSFSKSFSRSTWFGLPFFSLVVVVLCRDSSLSIGLRSHLTVRDFHLICGNSVTICPACISSSKFPSAHSQ